MCSVPKISLQSEKLRAEFWYEIPAAQTLNSKTQSKDEDQEKRQEKDEKEMEEGTQRETPFTFCVLAEAGW